MKIDDNIKLWEDGQDDRTEKVKNTSIFAYLKIIQNAAGFISNPKHYND